MGEKQDDTCSDSHKDGDKSKVSLSDPTTFSKYSLNYSMSNYSWFCKMMKLVFLWKHSLQFVRSPVFRSKSLYSR